MAKPTEPAMVMASPSIDADGAEMPFSETSTATPKTAKSKNVDWAESNDHGCMANASEMQVNCEAHLIYRDAEETQVEESPVVTAPKSSAAKICGLRKRP